MMFIIDPTAKFPGHHILPSCTRPAKPGLVLFCVPKAYVNLSLQVFLQHIIVPKPNFTKPVPAHCFAKRYPPF